VTLQTLVLSSHSINWHVLSTEFKWQK
jgi:hypothetical protein